MYLKFAREELEFALEILAGVQRLQSLQTFESDIPNLVVNGPSDVFQVEIVQKVRVILLHPLANLVHTNRADLGQDIAIAMHKHRLEHVREHVLDLVRVLLQLFSTSHERFETLRGSVVLLLGIVLTLSVLQVDGHSQGHVHKGRHQFHGS